ncbi:GMP synthase [Microbacterium sp. 10M-3C3]|jgi:GMP synthase (glutamine-hydrolysing)|uniref:glutamine amidotransferase-related protein n=1 Tax=Microbacterium sp. 10M-3C3 TaxID=2483401 RepID=UPI000F63CFBF|nr:GMP synthase [Microbacterium sp. 10M-3C3]
MPLPLLYVCVRPQRQAADGEYASFRAATGLGDALARHDLVREPLPDDAFTRYGGFVVGGSPFNLTDPECDKSDAQRRQEADLERIAAAAAEARTTALFTCYGIGVVTRMLGGEVSREFPEDTGPARIRLTPAATGDALFGGLPAEFAALTAHKEGAASAPPGAVVLAENDACPVQAYRVGTQLWATQFHPEPDPVAFTERMAIYRNDGYFDPEEYDVLAARVRAADVRHPHAILRAFAARATA